MNHQLKQQFPNNKRGETKEDLLEKWEITPKSMIYGDEKHVLKAIVLNSAKVTI